MGGAKGHLDSVEKRVGVFLGIKCGDVVDAFTKAYPVGRELPSCAQKDHRERLVCMRDIPGSVHSIIGHAAVASSPDEISAKMSRLGCLGILGDPPLPGDEPWLSLARPVGDAWEAYVARQTGTQERSAVIRLLSNPDRRLSATVAIGLSWITTFAPKDPLSDEESRLILTKLEALKDSPEFSDVGMRCYLIQALGNLRDAKFVPTLIDTLRCDANSAVRQNAAVALGGFVPRKAWIGSPTSGDPLAAHFTQDAIAARDALWHALEGGYGKEPTCIERDPNVRWTIVRTLQERRSLGASTLREADIWAPPADTAGATATTVPACSGAALCSL